VIDAHPLAFVLAECAISGQASSEHQHRHSSDSKNAN